MLLGKLYVHFLEAYTNIDLTLHLQLILLGSDPLEALFGKVHTISCCDSDVNQLQLANRTDSAVICTNILVEHPEWEQGPR